MLIYWMLNQVIECLTFTDENGRPIEIEYKVNLTLHSNEQKWRDIL